MNEQERYRWVAAHILPWEGAARKWLRRSLHTLSSDEVDSLVQEAYERVWRADFTRISDGRKYLYFVLHSLLVEKARQARVLPMERMKEIDALHMDSGQTNPQHRLSARQELERLLHMSHIFRTSVGACLKRTNSPAFPFVKPPSGWVSRRQRLRCTFQELSLPS